MVDPVNPRKDFFVKNEASAQPRIKEEPAKQEVKAEAATEAGKGEEVNVEA